MEEESSYQVREGSEQVKLTLGEMDTGCGESLGRSPVRRCPRR